MNNHIEISINTKDEELKQILIAELSLIGFDGFEESSESLNSYISKNEFDEVSLKEICNKHKVQYQQTTIEEKNWNQVWESNFSPVIVDDFAGIRADFHEPLKGVSHEILITPKMSFGTGHHATTYMMMQLMRDIDFQNKSVLDFGTGTGILAILAQKLGAEEILAIDNDDWCIKNASENIKNNNADKVTILKADSAKTGKLCDVVLANINRNIILDNICYLIDNLSIKSDLIVSGLLEQDEDEMESVFQKQGLQFQKKVTRNGWIALQFYK